MAQKALAPDKKSDYWLVDSRKIIEKDEYNRREDYGDIPKLAREIKAAGLPNLDPLTCYREGDNWVVLKGNRRLRALRILEKDGEVLIVRVIPAPRWFNIEDYIADQIGGNDGKNFTPWEKAKVVRDLQGLGWSVDDIVKKTGLTKVYVSRLLSLANAPQKLINLVRDGRLSGTEAMDLIAEGKVEEVIAKSEKGQPLGPVPSQDMFGEAPPQAPGTNKERMTRSDTRPNSWKVFKKWAPTVEEDKLPPVKQEAWNLIIKIRDGKATEEDFNNFFS